MPDHLERANVMIVDDTPSNLKLLQNLLEDRGCEVRMFPSGPLALKAAARNPPDLILLDVRMPEMDGFEVCRRLKADEALRDIPVLFISALSDTVDMVHAFFVGGVDYVTKPIKPDVVHARVATHLQIRSLQKELRRRNEELELAVQERTRDLARARERLLELGRIKDDLLRMISYEIRTPASGVLGAGRLLAQLCPDSDDLQKYKSIFDQSSRRLVNLIEDATMLADMEHIAAAGMMRFSWPMLLEELREELRESLPGVAVLARQPAAPESILLKGVPALLQRALKTLVLLALCFSRDKKSVAMACTLEGPRLRLEIELDDLSLGKDQAADFFVLESQARGSSAAADLGLASVLARNILEAFHGDLRLTKGRDSTGRLTAELAASPRDDGQGEE